MTGTPAQTANDRDLLVRENRMLRMKWGLWKGLFVGKGDGVDALNRASNVAGGCLQDALRTDILLGLARILDPVTQGSNHNLTLEGVIDCELCPILKPFRNKIKTARNKRIAHNDLKNFRTEHQIDFGVSVIEVDEAFACIQRHLEDGTGGVDDIWIHEGEVAAHSLIKSLVAKKRY